MTKDVKSKMPEIMINKSVTYIPGTQHVFDAESTLKNAKKHLDKIGVTRVAGITDLDRIGIPVITTVRPSAAEGAISVYSGKGSNEDQARISAMMESYERCLAERSGLNKDIEEDITATYFIDTYHGALARGSAVDPLSLHPSEPYTPDHLIEWTMAWDLLKDEEVAVPANAVFHPYHAPGQAAKLFRSNTNGLAAGNVLEEAILHGLLEVIERDALSMAEYNRDPGREIVLTPDDSENYTLLQKFRSNDVDIKLWLLTHDTGIATVVAVTDDIRLKDPALLVMGAGSHLKPEIAVRRALSEAAQSRAVQIHGAREDTDRESFVRQIGYERIRRMNQYWYDDGQKVSMHEIADLSGNSPGENIKTVLAQLKQVAQSAIIVDLSRISIPIPVIRVIIPGFGSYTLDRERIGNRIKGGKKKKLAPEERPWRQRVQR